jgi:hypothetical protein
MHGNEPAQWLRGAQAFAWLCFHGGLGSLKGLGNVSYYNLFSLFLKGVDLIPDVELNIFVHCWHTGLATRNLSSKCH